MNEDVVEYIRANRDTYTREAIDTRLREQGNSEEDIEAAWKVVHDDDALAGETARASAEKGASRAPQETASSLVAGCFRTVLFMVLILVGVAVLGLANLGLGYGNSNRVPLQWFVNLGTIVLLIAIVGAGSWLRYTKGWPGERVASVLAAVLLIWYLIVSGTCLYGVNTVH